MAYVENTIHNNNLFIRCWECGDSDKRSYVGHMNICLHTGKYFCYRCGASGILSLNDWLNYTSHIKDIPPPQKLTDTSSLDTLPYTDDIRFTRLKSQYNEDKGYRQWVMRKPDGSITGYHHRYLNKRSENVGKRGLGYVGSSLAIKDIVRVVEGVYDVVLPDSVCVFGKITSSSIRLLKHYDLCLCPDSDVVLDKKGLYYLYKTVKYNPNVLYVELLRDGDAYDYFTSGKGRGIIRDRNTFLVRTAQVLNIKKETNII